MTENNQTLRFPRAHSAIASVSSTVTAGSLPLPGLERIKEQARGAAQPTVNKTLGLTG